MQKFKDGFWFAWGLFLDGVDCVASWIAAYPKVTLALIALYVAVRQ